MDYTINPLTKRKIKVNGPIYRKLVKSGIIENSAQVNQFTIFDNPNLRSWMLRNNIQTIQPSTLIPLKVLLNVYNQYTSSLSLSPSPSPSSSIIKQLCQMVSKKDLKTFIDQNNITKINENTPLPFAIVMGPTVFAHLLEDS